MKDTSHIFDGYASLHNLAMEELNVKGFCIHLASTEKGDITVVFPLGGTGKDYHIQLNGARVPDSSQEKFREIIESAVTKSFKHDYTK